MEADEKVERVKVWIAALRSGRYIQGKGVLRFINSREETKYCCLGVACDIYDATRWGVGNGGFESYTTTDARWMSGGLPKDVREAYGLTPEEETTLVRMNDQNGQPFAEIADWLEANLVDKEAIGGHERED